MIASGKAVAGQMRPVMAWDVRMVSKDRSTQTIKNSVETPLAKMLKRIRRSEEFPSISKYLVEINRKLSAYRDTSDASDLANVILNDYALTNKLLKTGQLGLLRLGGRQSDHRYPRGGGAGL